MEWVQAMALLLVWMRNQQASEERNKRRDGAEREGRRRRDALCHIE